MSRRASTASRNRSSTAASLTESYASMKAPLSARAPSRWSTPSATGRTRCDRRIGWPRRSRRGPGPESQPGFEPRRVVARVEHRLQHRLHVTQVERRPIAGSRADRVGPRWCDLDRRGEAPAPRRPPVRHCRHRCRRLTSAIGGARRVSAGPAKYLTLVARPAHRVRRRPDDVVAERLGNRHQCVLVQVRFAAGQGAGGAAPENRPDAVWPERRHLARWPRSRPAGGWRRWTPSAPRGPVDGGGPWGSRRSGSSSPAAPGPRPPDRGRWRP